jgi:hypothetical protein
MIMTIAVKPPPEIQSIGAPSDLHAERIMAELARWIAFEGEKLGSYALAAKAARINDARPEQQIKVANMYAKAFGPLCLELAFVDTGKRGKYTFALLMLGVRGAHTNKPIVEVYFDVFRSLGNGKQTRDNYTCPCFKLSHHSLTRLAQRAGVRTFEDLVEVLREMSGRITSTLVEKPDDKAWRIELDDGCVAILEHDPNDDVPTVITVLTEDMLP